MTEREQQVLAMIRENPLISQAAIAHRLGISRPAVAGHIMNLVSKGIIKGRGYVISEAPFAAVIGGANIDICGSPSGELRMRDSNPGRVNVSPGGVARNIAENLARLGTDCRLISAVGHDEHGNLLCEQGEAAGIDMRYVLRSDALPTSTYVSVLDESGDMLVAINDMSIVDEISPDRLHRHEAMLRRASLIIVDTNLAEDTLAYIARTFGEQTLFVDTVSVAKAGRVVTVLDKVHTLKATRAEAGELCGVELPRKPQLAGVANRLHERGVLRVFISLGADGVFYSHDGEQGIEKAKQSPTSVENASGAGDAFVAGIAYAWLQDWPLKKSVQFSLSAADVALSHPATINPALSAESVHEVYEARYAG
ncbi:MAG: PfkB family carbohydrate kinase [Gammaproteobacteria bacterium]|nr:PfkB family carbohydrate kinase [Gammaproteobacteria bacterium]